jgi:hypothetical protein
MEEAAGGSSLKTFSAIARDAHYQLLLKILAIVRAEQFFKMPRQN